MSRRGGPLAVTDANLLLGRLLPDYFPKIFGKNENEGLDIEASRRAFEAVAAEVNAEFGKQLTLDEIVYGYATFLCALYYGLFSNTVRSFIKVANETMCRPIRSLTEAKGYALSKHV